MFKQAQYYQEPEDGFSALAKYMALPLGLGAGLYGLKSMWSGSPGLRAAAMLGGPYAAYQYYKYRDEKNIANDLADSHRKLVDSVQKNPNAAFIPEEQLRQAQFAIQQQALGRYREPAKSALYDALPLMALGAALPTALQAIRRP